MDFSLQNIENGCHQWLSDISKNSFSAGAPPRTPLDELTACTPQTSWFKRALLLRGADGRGRKGVKERRKREREGRGEGRKGK